ncbi:unnamed protein product [Penicillium roqueforti FM164]|uniref:Genomic scaffold, ProqFM164S03 n=1 Tax=Penicillium roqueforti (strain FM164) TaxID=1365484 RepID=W6QC01_PENRF|nr:unnamed protein product [Penicillium roqueforti FM164]
MALTQSGWTPSTLEGRVHGSKPKGQLSKPGLILIGWYLLVRGVPSVRGIAW